ncbi:MAG: AAA family ATPase [Ferrimicrobium sp.]
MRLLRIKIRNFRGVRECEVRLPSTGVTVISGPNEVGKSSLAEAIDVLFEYPHDSKHRSLLGIRPVQRDEGPEVEVELTTGPYRVIYSKRWLKNPETRLQIIEPRPENLVARQAHDKMEAILDETVDRDLFRALRFVQGEKVAQGQMGGSTTLIGALDLAAQGGSANPEAESTLFEMILEEKGKYFTPTGKVSQDRGRKTLELDQARTALKVARSVLENLEATGDKYRTTKAKLDLLGTQRSEADAELRVAREFVSELDVMERNISELHSQSELSDREETIATRALADRISKAGAGQQAEKDLAILEGRLASERKEFDSAEIAKTKLKAASEARMATKATAKSAIELGEYDVRYQKALVSYRLLSNRIERIESARHSETEALVVLDDKRVDKKTSTRLREATDNLLTARAALKASWPSFVAEALSDVDLVIDSESKELVLGESLTQTIAAGTTITVGELVRFNFRSGSSVDGLEANLAQAKSKLDEVVQRYALDPADPTLDLQRKLEKIQEAESQVKAARKTKQDALEDLSEEELKAKAFNSKAVIDSYQMERPDKDALIPETIPEAESRLEDAKKAFRQAEDNAANQDLPYSDAVQMVATLKERVARDEELLTQEKLDLATKADDLRAARLEISDVELEGVSASAVQTKSLAKSALDGAKRDYLKRDPSSAKLKLENSEKLVGRLAKRQGELEELARDLRVTLRVQGNTDLQAKIDESEVNLSRLERENEQLERNAEAVKYLYSTFEHYREVARLAYVAPYREQIESLAKLVFGVRTSIDVDPSSYAVTTRSTDGVTLPFESLSTGAKEQLSVLARLACAILVNPNGADGDAGVPVILDDALGYSDFDRMKKLAPAFTKAAGMAQVVIMTSTPERYAKIGGATEIDLDVSQLG